VCSNVAAARSTKTRRRRRRSGAAVPSRDRQRLERLCRYVARPPLAQERLEVGIGIALEPMAANTTRSTASAKSRSQHW
jgi:hypothetical protein